MKDKKFIIILSTVFVLFAISIFFSFHIANSDQCGGIFLRTCGLNKYCGDNNRISSWNVDECHSFGALPSCSVYYNNCPPKYKCTIESSQTYGRCDPIDTGQIRCFGYINNQCAEIAYFEACGTVKNSYLNLDKCLSDNPYDYTCGGYVGKTCPQGYTCRLDRPDIIDSLGQCVPGDAIAL